LLRIPSSVLQLFQRPLEQELGSEGLTNLVSFMSTELTGVPADRQPGTGQPANGSTGAFALPVSTSFRFTMLIAAVAASSFFVYEGIYLATPRGSALVSLVLRCRSQALAQRPSGLIAYASALQRAAVCYAAGQRSEGLWGLLGVGVLIAVAGVLFLAQPWWYTRRMHLTAITGEGTAGLLTSLEGVRQRAGIGPVVWLLEPLNIRLSAFAFGRPGRRFVAISGGAAVAAVRKPAAFDAVILHELAHIKNRDIDQAFLAVAIWRAFVVAALLPMAAVLVFSRVLGEPQRLIWRVALMALVVYLLRNAILRSREFDADARVTQLDPGIDIGAVLAGLPARTGRGFWQLGWTHPAGDERAAALQDPVPLFRFGFWNGLAVGLVAAFGASAASDIVTLLARSVGIRLVVPAVIFAAFAGPALAVAMWRKQLQEADTGAVHGWRAGLGLGLGLALGPVIALSSAYSQSLAPDHLNPAAVGLLAVWLALGVLIFTSLPVWIGHWADSWQLRGAMTAARMPAPGGLVVAAVAAWAVMTIGLYLLLADFTWIFDGASAAPVWHSLPELLNDLGFDVTVQYGSWVVCLVLVGVPVAAAIMTVRWRRAGDKISAPARNRRWMTSASLCLAGSVVVLASMLAVLAFAHARIAQGVRWSPAFLDRFVSFDEQAIVVVAAVCALVAAARARSALGVALSVAIGAAVGAVGGLTLPSSVALGNCFASFSLQYVHPPAGGCLTSPDYFALRQVVLGASLVSVLVAPGGYAVGMVMRRRISGGRLPVRVKALGWFGAALAIVAAVTGTALWGSTSSAHGVQAGGSIGNDGWIRGRGYDVRLLPSWYDLTRLGGPRLIYLEYPLDGAKIELQTAASVSPAEISSYSSSLVRLGARRTLLGGASGLLLSRSGLSGGVLAQYFIARGTAVQLITLYRAPDFPGDSPFLRNDFASILSTWRWTT
jgi:Zn-dependent protease with chaperone function